MSTYPVDPVPRFWAKVRRLDDGCWVWTGSLDSGGYGQLSVMGQMVRAHRFSFELHNGAIPDASGHHKTSVCHTCDRRECVNPAHLFLGSHAMNMADSSAKGRQSKPRGERSHRAKLSNDQVLAIYRSRACGVDLAQQYGVSQTTISAIRNKRVWTHLTQPDER